MGGEASSRGLARYRSAPATWLEALLESDMDEEHNNNNLVLLKPPQLSPDTIFDTNDDNGLFRQNSTPADFGSDSYFSTYQMIAPPSASASASASVVGCNYDFTPSPSYNSTKRPREDAFSSQLKEEDQSEQLERGLSGLLDPEMEKLLEDSVPCRVRAKRGCATHPRSIAERVRRTRISDRIRKLQELVPNMEKCLTVLACLSPEKNGAYEILNCAAMLDNFGEQTNTADMLEEAVEYVKLLQKQIQELTEQQKNCKCVHNE